MPNWIRTYVKADCSCLPYEVTLVKNGVETIQRWGFFCPLLFLNNILEGFFSYVDSST